MTMILHIWPRRLGAALALTLLPAACGGLLTDAPTRPLYRLNPSFVFPAALPHSSAQLLVATPAAPAGIDTARIALSRTPVSLDYFADAEWTDRVPFLVKTSLVEGFEKSGAIQAVGPEGLGLRADFVLETEVFDFQALYDSPSGPPRVVVRVNEKLVRMPDRRIIAQTSITREAVASANSLTEIVRAFERALGEASQQVVAWTLGNRALSERRADR